MRFRFRGLKRDTGRPVEGHVEAPSEEAAYHVLGDNDIVTEMLRPDPRPKPAQPTPAASSLPGAGAGATLPGAGHPGAGAGAGGGGWDMADVIDSAVDTASRQVAFDALVQRYRGKQVWVIDRDKIRRRVMQVIDQAMEQGRAKDESHEEVRARIAQALEGMFQDNRNLTREAGPSQEAMEQQLARLSRVVQHLERTVATLSLAARGGGGGGGGRRLDYSRSSQPEQNAVLLEIFESNLELRRQLEQDEKAPAETAPVEPAAATA